MGYSITQLREEYSEGSLTPTDAVEACFRNIEELDPQVRAWQSPVSYTHLTLPTTPYV